MAYVFAGLYLSVFYLYRRYRATPSRVEKKRLLYLLVGGFATVTASVAEAVPHGPSFGNIFIIVYLYFLSQNLVRYRLLDLNELLGRMVVLGTLVFILAFIYGVMVRWVGTDEPGLFFFNTLLASATIVILIEPLRTRVEGGISRWMFQEKFELSRRIEALRGELANVIDMRVLVPRVLGALEDSRRITHASVYLADPDGSGYELGGHVGPKPEGRFDAITHRAFFERLRRTGVITLEGIEREVAARRPVSTEEQESLQLMLRTLEQMYGAVALGFSSEDQLLGALVIRDDRLREAYSTDEIEIFRGVATTIGITLQNSQVYERMKERDRLAALGQMAAGLAHEIRNPLGSIKGAAQFLQPAQDGGKDGNRESQGTREGTREFLDIIVEEVNRLNKIVSQFLDYARPYRGEQRPLEVADVLKKTLSLLPKEKETPEQGAVEIVTTFADRMPPVRADAEQLLQVFLNLSLNAIQAVAPAGRPGQAVHLDGAPPRHPARGDRRLPRGAFPRHRRGDPGRRSQEPVHSVLHHQGQGDGPGAPHQPAHHREPRRDDRGPLAAGGGGDLHGSAADRGRRLRGLPGGDARGAAPRRRPRLPPSPAAAAPSGRQPPPLPPAVATDTRPLPRTR